MRGGCYYFKNIPVFWPILYYFAKFLRKPTGKLYAAPLSITVFRMKIEQNSCVIVKFNVILGLLTIYAN